MGVAHLALDLGLRHERGDRVDDDHVERTRPDQHVGDLERLLPRVGLGDVELVDVDADGRRVHRVHRVLGVDVGAHAAVALGLGDDVHGERRLPRRLGAVDLDDPAAGQPADAEGEVEREGAGGDRGDPDVAPLAELHDRALAVLLLDLPEGHVECLMTFHVGSSDVRFGWGKRSIPVLRRGCDSYGRAGRLGSRSYSPVIPPVTYPNTRSGFPPGRPRSSRSAGTSPTPRGTSRGSPFFTVDHTLDGLREDVRHVDLGRVADPRELVALAVDLRSRRHSSVNTVRRRTLAARRPAGRAVDLAAQRPRRPRPPRSTTPHTPAFFVAH